MGETVKKRHAVEAKAACKAKNDAEQATHPPPTSVNPIGSKPPDSSGSNHPKKLRAVPQEKMTCTPPSISTCHSTHSHSTSVTVSSGSGQQHTQGGLNTGSIATCPHCLATAAASDATFLADFYSVGNKIYKITKLFDRVVQFKNRGVTYWAERNGPAVVRIIRELKNRSKNRFL